MERHPSKRAIAALAAETVSPRLRARIENHLRRCERCAGEYARMRSLLEPRYAGRIVPPPSLREKVLASALTRQVGPTGAAHPPAPARMPRFGYWPVAAAAAITIALLTGFLALRVFTPAAPSLVVTAAHGTTRIDAAGAAPGKAVSVGNRIAVDAGSLLELSHGPDYVVRLTGGTNATIETMRPNKRTDKIEISYRLERGAFYSRAGENANIAYIVRTPFALFRSAGTEFLLVASDEHVTLVMVEGRLSVTAVFSGKAITAPEGKKILIGRSVVVSDASESDLTQVMRIADAKTGADITQDDLNAAPGARAVEKEERGEHVSGDAARETDGRADLDTPGHDKIRTEMRKESRETHQELQRVRRGGRGR